MRNHRFEAQIMKEFTKFRIGIWQQIRGRPQISLLVTYESGKLSAVETFLTPYGESVEQERWVWEITGDELTLTIKGSRLVDKVLHFKRV
jgi:hypothetical protein